MKIQSPALGTLSSQFFKSSLTKSTPRANDESRFPLQVFLSAEDDLEEDQIIERYSKVDESLTGSKNFKNSVRDSRTNTFAEKKQTVNSSRVISVDLFSEYLD